MLQGIMRETLIPAPLAMPAIARNNAHADNEYSITFGLCPWYRIESSM